MTIESGEVQADSCSLGVPTSLSAALIPNLPPSAYYVPNFVTPTEENQLLHHINNVPLPTWRTLSHRRLQAYPSPLSHANTLLEAPLPSWLAEPIIPRILSLDTSNTQHGTAFTTASRDSSYAKPLAIEHHNIFTGSPHIRPNHCLVNEYLPGQGIHPHEDGSAYWPVVCTVSLGSHTVLDISQKRSLDEDATAENSEQRKWRILQEQRSLLISTGELYTGFLHGIEGVNVDEGLGPEGIVNWDLLGDRSGWNEGHRERGTRVSLTFRDVLKVKRLGKAFGGLKR